MIKMRDTYHADISNGFNVRVYSTEPPEDLVVRLGHFLFVDISTNNCKTSISTTRQINDNLS